MKKLLCMGVFLLALLAGAACAQEYYTLPEIREQAAQGWHETITDKYGRTRQVDIDIDVFGEEKAPVLKAGFGDPKEFHYKGTDEPQAAIKEARIKKGGVSTYPFSESGMKVDLDEKYAEAYGNDLTLREIYAFIETCLQEWGVEQEYLWEQPAEFYLLYSKHKETGEILVPANYSLSFWPTEFGLPILTHAAFSFKYDFPGGFFAPALYFHMRDYEYYSGFGQDFAVEEVLAEDIPLCSVEKVIESAREMIEEGYIKEVCSLRFGYVVYSDPDNDWTKQRNALEVDTRYLVPSWVLECYRLENPKVDQLPEYPGVSFVTINAQTGEMLDHLDRSYSGHGDARYKGFISWEDVQ